MADTFVWQKPEIDRVLRSVRFTERFQPEPRQEPAPANSPYRPPIVVMLVEDLVSGGRAEAAVLRVEETNEVQLVTLRGEVTDGDFQLSWDGSTWTEPIPYDATAEELQAALEGLPQINPGDVLVSLGEVTLFETVYRPGRWSVQFAGQYEGVDVPLLQVRYDGSGDGDGLDGFAAWMTTATEQLFWDGESTETVRSLIPVGTPTPMLAKAIAGCIHYPGVGYVVWPVESLQYGILYA